MRFNDLGTAGISRHCHKINVSIFPTISYHVLPVKMWERLEMIHPHLGSLEVVYMNIKSYLSVYVFDVPSKYVLRTLIGLNEFERTLSLLEKRTCLTFQIKSTISW